MVKGIPTSLSLLLRAGKMIFISVRKALRDCDVINLDDDPKSTWQEDNSDVFFYLTDSVFSKFSDFMASI
jgi:hypothetical protein